MTFQEKIAIKTLLLVARLLAPTEWAAEIKGIADQITWYAPVEAK